MKILSVFSTPIKISGVSQIGLNIAECLKGAGHDIWVYIHPRPIVSSMYKSPFKKLRLLNPSAPIDRIFHKSRKAPDRFDLIIHNVGRKSFRHVPVFKGAHIAVQMTVDSGFQSYFYEDVDVKRVFFISEFEKRHFLEKEDFIDKVNVHGDSVSKSWDIARTWEDGRFAVLYPPMNEEDLHRSVRHKISNCGLLLKGNKVDQMWYKTWYKFLKKDLSQIVPVTIEIDTIKTKERKKRFWQGMDAVIWVSSDKEAFGMNLHEAIFSGCVPIVYKRNDSTVELLNRYSFGYQFKTPDELLKIVSYLKDKPSDVEGHSRLALEATEGLRYPNWYNSFMDKIKDIVCI